MSLNQKSLLHWKHALMMAAVYHLNQHDLGQTGLIAAKEARASLTCLLKARSGIKSKVRSLLVRSDGF